VKEDGSEEGRIKVSVNGKSGENEWRGVRRMLLRKGFDDVKRVKKRSDELFWRLCDRYGRQ
jgi:hypothetical protein